MLQLRVTQAESYRYISVVGWLLRFFDPFALDKVNLKRFVQSVNVTSSFVVKAETNKSVYLISFGER